MAKYAFIDFQNTDSTTKQLLGFTVDWGKLCNFLKNNWGCEKVFIYAGINNGDSDAETMFENLEKEGFIVRAKMVFAYKNKDKEINISCPKCGNKFIYRVDTGYNIKSNCDVDLTVDTMNLAKKDNIFYIFTGDGDFEFLIKNIISKGVKTYIVSSARKIKSGRRYFTSRLSTKLRKLCGEYKKSVNLIEINDLRLRIEKM